MTNKKVVKMKKNDGPVLNVAEDCVAVFEKSGYKKVEEVSIDKMNKTQLEAYAKKKGIDLGDAKTKEEILAKIKEVEETEV